MLYVLPPPAPSWPPASVARPPQPRNKKKDSGTGGSLDEEDPARNNRSLSECYFAGKGAAVVLPPNQRAPPPSPSQHPHPLPPRLSPGAAPSSPQLEAAVATPRLSPGSGGGGSDIQQHLQSMFYLLRPEETLKMAVKLESVHPNRTRYLVVVSCLGKQQAEESCLLGIDCNQETTVGLVLKVLADTKIKLDGDGGFKVNICNRQHIFKPVSVQAMWSALQTLYKVSWKAREENYFEGGLTHEWVNYYERRIRSEQSCLNEWHAMDNLESKRPPSPDSLRNKSTQRESTEENIRSKLKEIMMTVDLDEVTSKQVRTQLEEALLMDLGEYKPFIDQEMLVILGQMDAATEIFPHVYLGSEWNASNLDELNKNGVCHILNVTREIDNFFPGMFDYLNIRVYDDEKTDLLLHLENTFKYITKAQKEGSKVLVHCKMGVSRSASVVIAYAMKAYNWDLKRALEYVQKKRNCIKPNKSFITQLETYQGILDAKKNKEKLQRSGGETADRRSVSEGETSDYGVTDGAGRCRRLVADPSADLMRLGGGRPKSWSPDHATANALFPRHAHGATTLSLERLTNDDLDRQQQQKKEQRVTVAAAAAAAAQKSPNQVPLELPAPVPPSTVAPPTTTAPGSNKMASGGGSSSSSSSSTSVNSSGSGAVVTTQAHNTAMTRPTEAHNYNIKVQMPCDNGPLYSVSQNKILQLSSNQSQESVMAASVKHRVNALESATAGDMSSSVSSLAPTTPSLGRKERKAAPGLVLNLTSQFEEAPPPPPSTLVKKEEPWDPGESQWATDDSSSNSNRSSLAEVKTVRKLRGVDGDPFSNRLDRVFDREERKQQRNVPSVVTEEDVVTVPVTNCEVSRQSSWSSCDSAVVLRDCISRQSSWGSADTRTCTLPSRNSSWGSYDLRPSAPAPDSSTGTVKRTKQKLEQGSDTVKRVCPDTNREYLDNTSSRLANRVPSNEMLDSKSNNKENNNGNITRSVSVDETKLSTNTTSSDEVSPHSVDNQKCISGIVKNLKKEFEAKSVGKKSDRCSPTEEGSSSTNTKEESRSLPSSPVSEKSVMPEKPPRMTADDLSVRKLVGKYEDRPRLSTESEKRLSQPPVPLRKSSLDVQPHPPKSYINPIVHTFTTVAPVKSSNFSVKNSLLLTHNMKNAGRPPTIVKPCSTPSASVVAASVVAKAQSKKQQGKSHPLARLTINKRHNNPVYNTM